MLRSLSLRPLAFLVLASWLAACGQQQPPAASAPKPDPQAQARAAWQQFTGEFLEDTFKAQPFLASQVGRHDFDGQMPDWSAAGFDKEIQRLKAAQSRTQAFNAADLTPDQRYERQYLLNVLDVDLFKLDRARFPFTNPAWYIDHIDPEVFLSRDYAPLATRMKAYIAYARAIPKIAAAIRANLKVPMAKTLVERGISGFGGFADFYRNDVPKVFASVQDAAAQKDLADADAGAAKAMDELKKWLVSQRKGATDGYALGEAVFADLLKTEDGVTTPIPELMKLGQADLDRNLQALKEACAKYLPRGSLRACTAKMEANKPPEGPVEAARKQLVDLRAFIIKKQVVSVPGDEQALVAEAPPYNRANVAYINVPGPYDHGVAYTYNIAPPDPSWTKKERAEYIPGRADLLYTSVHEVWPGHFLQFLHSNRSASKIEGIWITDAFAEGWAHYAEQMMYDEGLSEGDVEGRVGQLMNALERNVRFISAIGLHTQGMTVAQSEKMFLDSAFMNPGAARQQAARGTYDPGYLCYTLGKLMIMKLREDWVASQAGGSNGAGANADPKSQWRAFHDKFLSYGGPPIPTVRQQMLGDNSGSDF
jgi:uncharacterized protein (DUF885 family)